MVINIIANFFNLGSQNNTNMNNNVDVEDNNEPKI